MHQIPQSIEILEKFLKNNEEIDLNVVNMIAELNILVEDRKLILINIQGWKLPGVPEFFRENNSKGQG